MNLLSSQHRVTWLYLKKLIMHFFVWPPQYCWPVAAYSYIQWLLLGDAQRKLIFISPTCNRDNARASIQFRTEKQPQHPKIRFFLKKWTINILINGTTCTSLQCLFFLIGIHSVQDWRATTRHGVTRKRSTKRLQYTGNLDLKPFRL